MGKIVAFLLATVGLSLAILIPCYYFFEAMTVKINEAGLFISADSGNLLWQGFAIIVFVVVVIVGTMLALIIWDGERRVL